MKKLKTLLSLWLLLTPLILCSQNRIRLVVFEIIPTEESHIRLLNVFMTKQDTVFSSSMCYEGRASFLLEDQIDKDVFIAFRLQNNCVYRIGLNGLLMRKTIETHQFTIHLVTDKYLSNKEVEYYRKHIVGIETEQDQHTKQWIDFSPEGQKRLYDTVRWFFPTEIMLNIDAQKERIHNSYYLQNYYDEFGRYPTEQELDTLAKKMSIGTAEELIGWCTWNLLRLKEDELCNGSLKDVYRFTMVSNSCFYKYEPYSMRIKPFENGTAIMYCSYERYDECERKELYCDLVPLDEENYSRFLNIVKQMRFWEAKPTENPNDLYKTKKTNILEANIDGKYHVIFRGEGEDEGMEELREFLWELTGLGENKIVHKRQRIE